MPRPQGTGVGVFKASVVMKDFGGDNTRSSVRLMVTSGSDLANFTALANAIGDATTAAALGIIQNAELRYPPASNPAYDDAYASATTKAVFVFQNAAGRTRKVEIPAPSATLFSNSNGDSIDVANSLAAAVISAAITLFANDGGPYTFVRGFRASRTRRTRFVPLPPPRIEPGVGAPLPAGGADNPILTP